MKVTFTFDKETRSINLEPEDDLETLILKEMEARCSKGSQIKISQVSKDANDTFRVELKVNGH